MKNDAPQGAVSLEDLNNMPGMDEVVSANPNPIVVSEAAPMDSFAVASGMQANKQLDPETLAKIQSISDNASSTTDNPNIAGGVQSAQAFEEMTQASTTTQANSAIDLTDSAEMPDAASNNEPAEANADETTPEPSTEVVESKSDEEIAAEAEAAREQTEAGLAEASSSMQGMHQNIMANVKKKENLAIKASISSQAKKRKPILSKKAKIIVAAVLAVAAIIGCVVFLVSTGIIYEKKFEVGNWTLAINTKEYDVNAEGSILNVTDKDEKYQFRFNDLGAVDHRNLLSNENDMKTLFSEQSLRYESGKEENFGTLACAVYKLSDHNNNDKLIYSAYCNKGDYMINIYATNYQNTRAEDLSRASLEAAVKIATGATRRQQQQE